MAYQYNESTNENNQRRWCGAASAMRPVVSCILQYGDELYLRAEMISHHVVANDQPTRAWWLRDVRRETWQAFSSSSRAAAEKACRHGEIDLSVRR